MAQQLEKVKPGDLIKADLINGLIDVVGEHTAVLSGIGGVGLVSVPNLVGRTFADARAVINLPATHMVLGSVFDAYGQVVNVIATEAQTRIVLNQTPPPGARVAGGTTLSLVLSVRPSAAGTVPSDLPVIKSFDPASTRIGEVVVINGDNFDVSRSANEVFFAGVKADTPLTADQKTLGVRIPDIPDPPTGTATKEVDVRVKTPRGEAASKTTVRAKAAVQKPVIASLTPTMVTQGSTLTITGTGFASTPANNRVLFESREVVPQGGAAGTLTVVIPDTFAAAFGVSSGNQRLLHVVVRNNETEQSSDTDDSKQVTFFMPLQI